MTSRTALLLLLACVALVGLLAPVAAQPRRLGQDRIDLAVDRAARYLASRQDPRDGSVCDVSANRAALTSLAVLALASAGHQATDSTPEGRCMNRAIRYILHPERQDEAGYFGNADGAKMYGHAICTLMLSEMLGQSMDDETDRQIRHKVGRAVDLILRAQRVRKDGLAPGGWRYLPDTTQSDLSVTVWQLMALRSAKNAGLSVPAEAIADGLRYVKVCYIAPTDARGRPSAGKSGFGYTPLSSKYMSTSTTAMGLLSLHLSGEYDSPFVRGAAEWLLEHPPSAESVWLFYGTYYYSQAMYQAGGRYRMAGARAVSDLLLPEQRTDGSWLSPGEKEREVGAVYATSLGLLALTVKYHYLPIYQH